MERIGFTKQIQAALKRAAKDSMLATCATETGVTVKQIYAMSSRGTMNTDDTIRVAVWLVHRGYLLPSALPWVNPDNHLDALNELADMVGSLIPILRNPDLPVPDRLQWVRSNLDHLYLYLEVLSDKQRKSGNPDN